MNKILVVDDEKEIADLVELYLKNENYTVYKYYSAKEVLDNIDNLDGEKTKSVNITKPLMDLCYAIKLEKNILSRLFLQLQK